MSKKLKLVDLSIFANRQGYYVVQGPGHAETRFMDYTKREALRIYRDGHNSGDACRNWCR